MSETICIHCGKKYKKIEKHIILCEIIHKSNHQLNTFDDNDIPSQKKMFKMLLVMAAKYGELEKKLDNVHNYVQKKIKKINIVEYLNNHLVPSISINKIHELIHLQFSDVEFLFEHNIFETINEIFSRCIQNISSFPIISFIQKPKTLYAYTSSADETTWNILSHKQITVILEFIQFKLSKEMLEWKRKNKTLIDEDDRKCWVYDKSLSKLMAPDFKSESVIKKYQDLFYTKFKTDIKCYIDYEFD
jgi:hypothetical protein